MTRDKREALSQRICNFYHDSSNNSVKTMVNFFKNQNIPRNTVYYILTKYLKYGITKDRPRSGRPAKLSNRNLNNLVKSVNNRCGLSQRKMARRYHVDQSTISRNLRRRTSIVIKKRRKAPKMNSEEQQTRARKNCGKVYRKLLDGCDVIIDDEKYFKLSGNNVVGNRYYYSTNPTTAPPNIKLHKKAKFEPKVMIWMAMSSKGISDIYVHNSKQGFDQQMYLKECISKRLLPFIDGHHSDGNYLFWPDLASTHYSNVVQKHFNDKNVPFISRADNPPNTPQARPIERVWSVLEQKMYANNWEAKNKDHLLRRIKQMAKELDQKMLQNMMKGVKKRLRRLWRDGLNSVH
jgi:transposase